MAADAFWNRLAKKYERTPVPSEEVYQAKLRKTQALFTPTSNVLEFGCGTGTTAVQHAKHVAHIDALDFSAKMIDFCQQKKAEAGVENVRFVQATLQSFSPPDAHYDVVLGLSILHLLEERDEVIGRVYQTLKPGGYFVSSTTCIADSMKALKHIAPLGAAIGLLPQINVFSRQNLEDTLTKQGFVLEEVWQPNDAVFIVARK
ncbi:class I SAM-dependent methyltransferase [Salinibius halmophilus]|uniref:class I SAM-dependent methyltransferase n=1 Tax=Salinibius halmophilus TaxID=1853216 RepID=UPI000E66B8AE|nr:class I SAM-dependent methyltransferase [Salinibius halmophilus]